MAVRVKICGITNSEDACAAVESGADALGFIFYPNSPRFVDVGAAAAMIGRLPPFVAKVGVFVDEILERIVETVSITGIDTVQLHGSETPEFCDALRRKSFKVIKAFRVKDQGSLAGLKNFPADAILLDSYVPGQLGGTGARFNWELAIQAKAFGFPIILAGGLDPANVADAVSKVAPYGVDVSSGVESGPGKKDGSKVRAFIARAKGVG